ncbi:hypothetical protein [Paenibacillus rigui]|nr:hypothetical protein [Paenibacillus rigui]
MYRSRKYSSIAILLLTSFMLTAMIPTGVDVSNVRSAEGHGDGRFKPEQLVTRAELVAMAIRLAGFRTWEEPVTTTIGFKNIHSR